MKIFKKREVVIPPIPEKETNPGVCPEFISSIFSQLTFEWVQPVMSLGSKRPLEREDLWELTERRRAAYIATLFREKWANEIAKRDASRLAMKNKDVDYSNEKGSDLKKKKKSGKTKEYKPSLWIAINNTFLWVFWSAGVMKVIGDSLQVREAERWRILLLLLLLSPGVDDFSSPPSWILALSPPFYPLLIFSAIPRRI